MENNKAHPAEDAQALDLMVEGYAQAALWSSSNDDGESLDEICSGLDAQSMETAKRDCRAFAQLAGADALAPEGARRLGFLFFLNRCGHGTGFWDEGLGEAGERLSKLCELFGEADVWEGPSGEAVLEPRPNPELMAAAQSIWERKALARAAGKASAAPRKPGI